MFKRHRLVVVFFALTLALPAAPGTAIAAGGSRALTGAGAAAFRLPADVVPVWEARLANGLAQTRFQQRVDGADVLGGQLTLLRDGTGQLVAVIGAHYPGLRAGNARVLTVEQARRVAAGRIGQAGVWSTTLMIDPADSRLFYWVENQRFDARWIHWIDAASGAVRNAFNATASDGPGTGVKGDSKSPLDTRIEGGTNVLWSDDNRLKTHDMRNARNGLPGALMSDPDDTWNTLGVASPGQPAGVDAHFYANVVDDFYQTVFGRNSIDNEGMTIVSSVHYARKYNNAFWNGSQMVYGDGDQRQFREFSGSLEVVGHELTHGVTQFTSNLIYQGESGALNESFSDIIGATIERATNEPLTSNCVVVDAGTCNDWALAEDLTINSTDDVAGFRNMADPQEDVDPDHYSELINDPSDSGGVHSNSGVPNHAYYLLVEGGQNAGCDSSGSDGHTHTADCTVTVSGIGLSAAAQIFYTGFTSLQQNSNMCDARAATLAAASVLGTFSANVGSAWDAVGIHSDCTGAPPPPSCDVPNATIPFESEHPYSPNQDCTWTYDNGSASFRLHFSLLDTEAGFDFVNVIDGNGLTLHEYSGRFVGGTTTDCITTPTVDVQLVTDPLINKRGFIVDAVLGC